SRRRHTRCLSDWSSDVCSSDLTELLAETPVDQLQVMEKPTVIFRVNGNTWLDAIVRYLVRPREAGRIKTRLIKKMLERLNAEPRSEERRVGKEGRSRGGAGACK